MSELAWAPRLKSNVPAIQTFGVTERQCRGIRTRLVFVGQLDFNSIFRRHVKQPLNVRLSSRAGLGLGCVYISAGFEKEFVESGGGSENEHSAGTRTHVLEMMK